MLQANGMRRHVPPRVCFGRVCSGKAAEGASIVAVPFTRHSSSLHCFYAGMKPAASWLFYQSLSLCMLERTQEFCLSTDHWIVPVTGTPRMFLSIT